MSKQTLWISFSARFANGGAYDMTTLPHCQTTNDTIENKERTRNAWLFNLWWAAFFCSERHYCNFWGHHIIFFRPSLSKACVNAQVSPLFILFLEVLHFSQDRNKCYQRRLSEKESNLGKGWFLKHHSIGIRRRQQRIWARWRRIIYMMPCHWC